MDRPKTATEEIKTAAATEVAQELLKCGHLEDSELGQAIKDLCNMSCNDDGYEIAKELDDRYYWDCRMEMVDVLDGYGWAVRKRIEAAEKSWAEDNNITPPIPVGSRVTMERRGESGTITGVYEYGAAKYLIAIDGDKGAKEPTRRRSIVNFEDVIAAP